MIQKTTRVGARYTTAHLAIPLPAAHRHILAAVVLAISTLALIVSLAAQDQPRAIQEAQPRVVRDRVIYVVATPTPRVPEPTAAPAIVAAPPTAAPEIVSQTVEVPIDVDVSSAPVAEPAAPVDAWHPPLIAPGPCADWRPPQPYPAGCP